MDSEQPARPYSDSTYKSRVTDAKESLDQLLATVPNPDGLAMLFGVVLLVDCTEQGENAILGDDTKALVMLPPTISAEAKAEAYMDLQRRIAEAVQLQCLDFIQKTPAARIIRRLH